MTLRLDPDATPGAEGRPAVPFARTLGAPEERSADSFQGKALVLLSYLSLNGPQARRRVAVLFWPRATDRLNRLSVTLSRIRAVSRDAIGADRQRVWTALVTDAALVSQALDEGRTDEALALYGGAFLADAYLDDVSEELEEWIASTHDGLARRIQAIRLAAASTHAQAGRFAAAAAEAVAAMAAGGTALLDPDELASLHTLLLAGEHPGARAVGSEANALGVAIEATSGEARARLQRAHVDPPIQPDLRSHGTAFVGRDAERLELARMLALPDRRLITLIGPGGAGKTRLAQRVAADHLQAQRYPDGVYVVALEDEPSADAIPLAIAETLDLTLAPDRPALEALAEAIGDRCLLLVVDNLEHLTGSGAVLDDLLARCRFVTLLATSRDRVAIRAEWLFPVDGLRVPDHDPDPADVHAWSALTLFDQRAQRVQPSFALTQATIPHVVAICRLVRGSPLAIELAASHVAIMRVAEIEAEVRADLDVLVATDRYAPARHHSMRVVFDHAWRRLRVQDREALERLAVFRGGFDRAAARTIAGATLDILTSLVTQALIVRRRERFDLHPLVHQYAEERLAEDTRTEAEARRRHATWSLDLAVTAFGRRNTVEGGRWLDRLDAEHANLRAALDWADAAGDVSILEPLTNHLVTFWVRRGHHAEALRRFEALRQHAPALGASVLARSLPSYAFVATVSGAYDLASDQLETSLAIACQTNDPALESLVRSHMGILAFYSGRSIDAARHYAAALDIAHRLGERETVARLRNNLGDVARTRGDLAEARRHYEASLETERALGDQQMVSNVLGSLSQVALAEGNVGEARALLRESIDLLRELGITFSFPVAFDQAGTLAASTGRPLDGARLSGAAEALRERLRTPLERFLRTDHDDAVARSRVECGAAAFESAWDEGRHLSVHEATAIALAIC